MTGGRARRNRAASLGTGWTTAIGLVGALGCNDPGSAAVQPGTEGGPCIDGSCLQGLECLSEICVGPDADSQATTAGAGSNDDDGTGAGDDGGGNGGPGGADNGGDDDPGGEDEDGPGDDDGGESGPVCDPAPCACDEPLPPCDEGSSDPIEALGAGCDGSGLVQGSTFGAEGTLGSLAQIGDSELYVARHGQRLAVLGSGYAADLSEEPPPNDSDQAPTHCSDDVGAFDPGSNLPDPIDTTAVIGDCIEDPGVVGTGDCSNTLAGLATTGANDYAQIRLTFDTGADFGSLQADLAVATTEYPAYVDSQYGDMFLMWVESERWTGNAVFDDSGQALGAMSSFNSLKDDNDDRAEFAGTCFRGHSGTRWLHVEVPVETQERIIVILGIFDTFDSILDSYAFVDGLRLGCPTDGYPTTSAAD